MQILSEEQIRQRISQISERYPTERQKLQDAYKEVAQKEAKTHLAITFRQPELLSNEKAREYLQTAVDSGQKLTESDKSALVELELEGGKLEYDLAKFDCETSEKDFKQLETQLSFYQSLMKLV